MTLIPYAGKDNAEVPFAVAFKRGAPKSGINPRFLEGRAKLIAISREYQRRQDERKAAEEARLERLRAQAAKDKAKWKKRLKAISPKVDSPSHYMDVISMVACWHGVTVAEIMKAGRSVHVVAARHDAIAAVYLNCNLEGKAPNLPSMGRAFKRDHTSVLHALRKRGIVFDSRASASVRPA